MEHILIPSKRAKLLMKIREEVGSRLGCSIEIKNENEVLFNGDAYNEFNAKNVVQAFGRGIEMEKAYRLLNEEYFSKFVNLKDFFKNEEQIRRIKARIIGSNGKTKLYMEEISGAEISVYGNTIAMIGKIGELNIASAALQVLIEGGTHKKAYVIMERMRRKLNESE